MQGFTAISGVPSLGWLIASRVEDTQLLRSLDYGRTWQPLVLPAGYTEFLQLEQGALWARNVTAVQVSTDMGSTWAAATWPAGADVTTTRVMQTSPTRLLAQAANGAGGRVCVISRSSLGLVEIGAAVMPWLADGAVEQ